MKVDSHAHCFGPSSTSWIGGGSKFGYPVRPRSFFPKMYDLEERWGDIARMDTGTIYGDNAGRLLRPPLARSARPGQGD